MTTVAFCLYVLMGVWLAALPFARTPDRRRLGLGIVGWLMVELLVAAVTVVIAALQGSDGILGSPDYGAEHRTLAIGGGLFAALLVVPFLQVRRYRRRPR